MSSSSSGDELRDDPFLMVYEALWSMVEDSAPLEALVRPGNRIRFDKSDDRDPFKVQISTADLPELMLTSEGTSGLNLQGTSTTSTITRKYSWILATGDYRYVSLLYPVEWALLCAMTEWVEVLTALEWRGNSFVTRCNFVEVSEGYSDPKENRGIKGWSTIWRCEVRMDFATADMKAFNSGE